MQSDVEFFYDSKIIHAGRGSCKNVITREVGARNKISYRGSPMNGFAVESFLVPCKPDYIEDIDHCSSNN